nr:hypothetical protein [Hepelivirales sp.]
MSLEGVSGHISRELQESSADYYRDEFGKLLSQKYELDFCVDLETLEKLNNAYKPITFSIGHNEPSRLRSHPIPAVGMSIATRILGFKEKAGGIRIGHDFNDISEKYHHCFDIQGRDQTRILKAINRPGRNLIRTNRLRSILNGETSDVHCSKGFQNAIINLRSLQ